MYGHRDVFRARQSPVLSQVCSACFISEAEAIEGHEEDPAVPNPVKEPASQGNSTVTPATVLGQE